MNDRIIEIMRDAALLKIANRAASRFYGSMNKEEIDSCIINAVWKALQSYEEGSNCKFSSYLYIGVLMECQAFYRTNIHKKEFSYIANTDCSYKTLEYVDMMDEIYTYCEDPDIIYDRYYKEMTVQEIADKTKKSGQTIRVKIKKDLERLKSNLLNGV
jgi:hypothetical protein